MGRVQVGVWRLQYPQTIVGVDGSHWDELALEPVLPLDEGTLERLCGGKPGGRTRAPAPDRPWISQGGVRDQAAGPCWEVRATDTRGRVGGAASGVSPTSSPPPVPSWIGLGSGK